MSDSNIDTATQDASPRPVSCVGRRVQSALNKANFYDLNRFCGGPTLMNQASTLARLPVLVRNVQISLKARNTSQDDLLWRLQYHMDLQKVKRISKYL